MKRLQIQEVWKLQVAKQAKISRVCEVEQDVWELKLYLTAINDDGQDYMGAVLFAVAHESSRRKGTCVVLSCACQATDFVSKC